MAFSHYVSIRLPRPFLPPCIVFVKKPEHLPGTFPHSQCCWLHPVVCLTTCFVFCICCKLVVWSLELAQVRFLASVLQRWCCVCPVGATYCPAVSPSVTLTVIGDHLDPLIYYQGDANTQRLGLAPLVYTVPVRGPRPVPHCLCIDSPWTEAQESDDSGPSCVWVFFFSLDSGCSWPIFLNLLVS